MTELNHSTSPSSAVSITQSAKKAVPRLPLDGSHDPASLVQNPSTPRFSTDCTIKSPTSRPPTYSTPHSVNPASFRAPRYHRADGLLQTTPTTRLPSNFSQKSPRANGAYIDIADDYNNFGGGVNPLGYKGHTFTGTGYGPVSIPSPPSPQENVSRTSQDSTVVHFRQHHERPSYSTTTNASTEENESENESNNHEDSSHFLCPSLGSANPFFVALPLSRFSTSPYLPDSLFLAWRAIVFFLLTSFSIVIAIQRHTSSFTAPSLALVTASIASVVQFYRATQYILTKSASRTNNSSSGKPELLVSSFEVLLCQATPVLALILGFLVPTVVLFRYNASANEHRFQFYRSVTFILLAIALGIIFLDIIFTKGLTRVTYVLPIALLTNCLVVVSVWGLRESPLVEFAFLSTGLGLSVGILLHMLTMRLYLLSLSRKPVESITTENHNNVAQIEEV